MALTIDAICATDLYRVNFFSQERISKNVLEEMFLDLDENEVVSIIFLMTNKSTDLFSVINALKEDCKKKFFEIINEKNWGEKLLEALITIDNINVIKRLAYTAEEIAEMKIRYSYNIHNVSENLNRIVKSLYFLCKELTVPQVKKLVNEVYKDLKEPVLQLSEDKMFLEIFILDWLQKQYISIDIENLQLNKFISILKINGLLPINFDFEIWKVSKNNQQDSSQVLEQSLHLVNGKNIVDVADYKNFPWIIKDHKRLCIIVNQVNFIDESRYAERKGSDLDARALQTTFEGLHFHVTEGRNLTSLQMNNVLDELNKSSYHKFAAIFLCILSHGQDGEVIFSDDKSIKVKDIQKKFCCQNLQNVFKFIILQTCQGKKLGFINNKLTSDSPVQQESSRSVIEDSTSIYKRHFALYQATVNEYISVRHETEGSWFIQDACDELQKATPIKLGEWVTNVNKRVNDRKAETNYKDTYIVQVPCLKESTISVDYEFPKYEKIEKGT